MLEQRVHLLCRSRLPLRRTRRAVAILPRAQLPVGALTEPPAGGDGAASAGADAHPAGDAAPAAAHTASVALPGFRRRQLVRFTCNKCGVRTERAVNPAALARGTVFVQCDATAGGCGVWHKLVDNLELWGEEVVLGPLPGAAAE